MPSVQQPLKFVICTFCGRVRENCELKGHFDSDLKNLFFENKRKTTEITTKQQRKTGQLEPNQSSQLVKRINDTINSVYDKNMICSVKQ